MGTTVVALQLVGDSVQIAHVGDSRAYRWRAGVLECLTRDHTLAGESPGQFERFAAVFGPQRLKSILTRAIGVEHAVEVASREEPARLGDRYLLCSDGLSGMVGDDEIGGMLARDGRGAEQVCQALVDRANQLGGRDNVTVIVVDLIDGASEGR
jgi:protein phosphatase